MNDKLMGVVGILLYLGFFVVLARVLGARYQRQLDELKTAWRNASSAGWVVEGEFPALSCRVDGIELRFVPHVESKGGVTWFQEYRARTRLDLDVQPHLFSGLLRLLSKEPFISQVQGEVRERVVEVVSGGLDLRIEDGELFATCARLCGPAEAWRHLSAIRRLLMAAEPSVASARIGARAI